jgi:hypothetical protein
MSVTAYENKQITEGQPLQGAAARGRAFRIGVRVTRVGRFDRARKMRRAAPQLLTEECAAQRGWRLRPRAGGAQQPLQRADAGSRDRASGAGV